MATASSTDQLDQLLAAIVSANNGYIQMIESDARQRNISFAAAAEDLGYRLVDNAELRIWAQDPPGQIRSFNFDRIAMFHDLVFEGSAVNAEVEDLLPCRYWFGDSTVSP